MSSGFEVRAALLPLAPLARFCVPYSDLAKLSALGDVMGRFGVTNWRASGSAVIFGDGVSDSRSVLGGNRSSLACEPLRLGVLPLLIGSVRFNGNSQFEAKGDGAGLGKVVKGKLIVSSEQNVSGIEYEVEGLTGWSYIVMFLSDNQHSVDKSSFPLHRWASFALGPTETNFTNVNFTEASLTEANFAETSLMCMTEISGIEVTKDTLPDNYFHPSHWLSQTSPIPVVNAYIVKNQVMVKMDGRLVPATSGITIRPITRIRAVLFVLLSLTIIPIFLVVWHLKRKISSNGKTSKST